jgi:hypothetical protein
MIFGMSILFYSITFFTSFVLLILCNKNYCGFCYVPKGVPMEQKYVYWKSNLI